MTRITTPAALSAAIATNFPTNREFVKAFNQAGGELTEQQLSKHLHGARSLSKGWRSAYSLYFGYWVMDKGRRRIELINIREVNRQIYKQK